MPVGHGGELLLPLEGALDGPIEAGAELGVLATEAADLLPEAPSGGAAGVEPTDRVEDLAGMAVGGLAAAADEAGLPRDGAIGPAEAGGGIGDRGDDGYVTHGGWLRGVWFVVIPTLANHPPPSSTPPRRLSRKSAPTVNLVASPSHSSRDDAL